MADYSITITVDAADDVAQLAAMKWRYGQVIDDVSGLARDMTDAEVKAKLKETVVASLIRLHTRHAKHLALRTTQVTDPPNIT